MNECEKRRFAGIPDKVILASEAPSSSPGNIYKEYLRRRSQYT
jgi:hypothetical protein